MIPETRLAVSWTQTLLDTIAPGILVTDELPDDETSRGTDGLTEYQRGVVQVEALPTGVLAPVPGLALLLAEVRLYLAPVGRGVRADWDRAERIVQALALAVALYSRRTPELFAVGEETALLNSPFVALTPSRRPGDPGGYAIVAFQFGLPWRMT